MYIEIILPLMNFVNDLSILETTLISIKLLILSIPFILMIIGVIIGVSYFKKKLGI
jgi:hypothetical protein